MNRSLLRLLPAVLLSACAAEVVDDDDVVEVDPLPEFVDDCTEESNDDFGDFAGLLAENLREYDAQLCEGDVDWYRIDVPPGRWVSVELQIDGSGRNATDGTDLDLFHCDEVGDDVWSSAHEQDWEMLSFANLGDEPESHYLRVDPYNTGAADYTLAIRTASFHEGIDCGEFYEDTEDGQCNRIMQWPAAQAGDGYFVEHLPHYSFGRREMLYLVRYATAAVTAQWPDTMPLATLDIGERDGGTPGAMVGSLRHPEGTHVEGNDIDLAYYQTGEDNAGRSVCPHDNYFCTGDPHLLDARKSAFFIGKLMESDNIRVIGVDPAIASALRPAATALRDEGLMTDAAHGKFWSHLASGDGWPFHQHHMHVSWAWESGWEGRDTPEGCLLHDAYARD